MQRQSTSSWVVICFSTRDNGQILSSELKEAFLIESVEESTTMLHPLHDHSLIRIIMEMSDFVCLCRQFPSRFKLFHLLLSTTERGDLKSAAMAAARPATAECLMQPGGRPLCWVCCASSRAQATRRNRLSELAAHHCPATAANQGQMYGADCYSPATTTALSVSGGLLGLNVACSSHLSQYVI